MRYLLVLHKSKLHKEEEHHHKHHDEVVRPHVPAEEVMPHKRDFVCIEKVIYSPPVTWAHYAGVKDGWLRIIEMEMGELQTASENGDYKLLIENLIHVAAAAVHAHHKMTCDK